MDCWMNTYINFLDKTLKEMSLFFTSNLYIHFNGGAPKAQHHKVGNEEGDCPTLLCNGVASPWTLCAVLGTTL